MTKLIAAAHFYKILVLRYTLYYFQQIFPFVKRKYEKKNTFIIALLRLYMKSYTNEFNQSTTETAMIFLQLEEPCL